MKGRWSWLLGAAAAAMALGSGCTGASLVADVTVPAEVKSTCIRVVALADGAEITSQLIERPAGADPLRVAIFEPQGRERPVTAVARGYVGNGCNEPLLLNDESAPVDAEFKLGSGGSAALALLPPPPAVDSDRDGYRQAAAGGPDCDDRRVSIHPGPGADEVCGDAMDNDCNGQVDCEQTSCLNQACGGGRSCTQSGTCVGQEAQCTNGQDDDLDGLIDCLDPDCDNVGCDDGDPCTNPDRCQAGTGRCSGNAVICNSPGSNPCLGSTGTCNPADGGCLYTVIAGQTCASGICDHDGGCGPLYAYAPTNFTPPDAGSFVPLKLDCGGTMQLDTTPTNPNPFSGATCGQTLFPALINKTQSGGGGDVAIVPVESLSVASNMQLSVVGPRPVIFAVFGEAQIDGTLVFSSGTGPTSHGAGIVGQCSGGTGIGQVGGNGTSGGGGGGGSYGSQGAQGGGGIGSNGGNVGNTYGNTNLNPLIGGCAGGGGGNTGGPGGGGGGGAIQISATETITVRGSVGSPGGGGPGGASHQTGGSGGGAGGAVLLEGKSIRISTTGRVSANGGGGGEGDACCAGGTLDGDRGGGGNLDANRAGGGANGGAWAAGGNGGLGAAGQTATAGSVGTTVTQSPVTFMGGGGGGGGGLGRLRFNATQNCQIDGGV
ncbi:MAG TPA: putative metal-binding motif-containing protein, partial [Myxococcaceae bacterium]